MPILISVIVILIIVILILILCLFNMKHNVKQIDESLKFINSEETNAIVRISTKNKHFVSLTNTINKNIIYMSDLRKKINYEENKIVTTITNLSHDLRTPLTSILGYTQLVMKEKLSEKQVNYVNIINERIKHLRELVDELYEYSLSYNEKELKIEKVNVKPLLEETLLLFYNDFVDKKYEVKINIIEEEIFRIIDVNMLKRVFYNVISNALKYGKDLFEVGFEKGVFIFSNIVINTDVIDIEKIFDRFFTVAKARTEGASGLGLSISKKIIEDLGGQINATLTNNILSVYIKI